MIIENGFINKPKPRRGEIIKAMPGTFSQIYIQTVIAVKGRENIIGKQWKDELD